MKPVIATAQIPARLPVLFEKLQSLGDHEEFTNHMLVDWELSGPKRGVGAKARVHTTGMGPSDTGDIEIVDVDEHEWRITERAVGAGGRRQTTGEYALFPLSEELTEVRFTLRFDELPARERVMAPLLRRIVHRANHRALDRLAAQFTARTSGVAQAA